MEQTLISNEAVRTRVWASECKRVWVGCQSQSLQLLARQKACLGGMKGRKEGSEQKRWKEEAFAFVRGTEWSEGEEDGKESASKGGRKGNKSADTIAFLDEIQTCNSSEEEEKAASAAAA